MCVSNENLFIITTYSAVSTKVVIIDTKKKMTKKKKTSKEKNGFQYCKNEQTKHTTQSTLKWRRGNNITHTTEATGSKIQKNIRNIICYSNSRLLCVCRVSIKPNRHEVG